MRKTVCSLLMSLAIAALGAIVPATVAAAGARQPAGGADDVTVVAILDGGLNPYHWDFLASKMPQARDKDPSNDLPLDTSPDRWLPGFPAPKSFAHYEGLKLNLEEKNAEFPMAGAQVRDATKWSSVKASKADQINYYWFPGTKVIGAIDFGGGQMYGETSAHGVGVSSVSVGNLHGTCPECLLVFIDYGSDPEGAMRWATSQPWIDVVSNSYGHGGPVPKIYNGETVEDQRAASERGQTIFFSAGNGFENAYTVPNPTYMSSQKGPDWLITVGAVNGGEDNYYDDPLRGSANHASFSGAGKPVDVAGVGADYPSAYRATTVGGTGRSGFGGTSNAAPTVAGTYARALYLARLDLAGPSRIQRGGVIAAGGGFRCGKARPACELGDGKLTATELRTRLLHGAIHTPAGMTTFAEGAQTPAIGEEEFMNEGHGTYFARETGKVKDWLKEFERVLAPLEGRAKTLERPAGEREWMTVDSYCRQDIWGAWRGGYYIDGKTELPGPDPSYPLRSLLEQTCPALMPPP